MTREDRRYYEVRAEAELTAALISDHPEDSRAHYLLAGFYLDLVHGEGNNPSTGDQSDTSVKVLVSGSGVPLAL